jgi:NIPSNAP
MQRLLVSALLFVALLSLAAALPLRAQDKAPHGPGVVEIRSYNLKPGTRDGFHKRFVGQVLPMLRRYKVDVVAYGPSLADSDSYFLIRAFPSLDARQKSEDAFYGSDEWKQGMREAVLGDIVNYTTIVRAADTETLRALRTLQSPEHR